jgi:hypothetical protein
MGSSKPFDALAAINLNGGGNRSDETGSPECFLWIEIVLVISVFFQA